MRENPLVIDIAANDGCCLEQFRDAGFERFLAVEPSSNLAQECISKRIPCSNSFWSYKTARSYRDVATQGASFIIAQNVLAHVDDLRDFIRGVCWSIEPDGVFVAEFPYLPNIIKYNQFDTIYHEHLSYFLLEPLSRIFSEEGLPIFKVEKLPIHGGSLRIYASKHPHKLDNSVEDMLIEEDEMMFYNFTSYKSFSDKVDTIKDKLKMLLECNYHAGKKTMGYGASAKGMSLINYCGIPKEWIHSIVDDTPDKQGKFTTDSNIPIVDFSHFEKEKPDFILLLAWNFESELREKTKHIIANYIVPIPDVRIA